jgi:beta-glucanase (GH16 family)
MRCEWTKALLVIAAVGTALNRCPSARADLTTGWQLTWSDEFTNSASGLAPLTYTLGNPDGAPELETYTNSSQNVFVGPAADSSAPGGSVSALHIDTIYNGKTYTSGFVDTSHAFSQAYGLFEIRAKLPQGAGLWPAIWLMPENAPGQSSPAYGGWPGSGEIDIMESGAAGTTNRVQGSVHSGTWADPVSATAVYHPYGSAVPFSTSDWHTYGLEWEPDSISFFVDDQVYETLTPTSITKYINGIPSTTTQTSWVSPAGAPAGDTMAPFDQPFYLIMNMAVGGEYAGTPNLAENTPYDMDVNYVRFYQPSTDIEPVPEPAAPLVLVAAAAIARRRKSPAA